VATTFFLIAGRTKQLSNMPSMWLASSIEYLLVCLQPGAKFIGAIKGVVVLKWLEALMVLLNHPQIFMVQLF
jgi:hypothetical protein